MSESFGPDFITITDEDGNEIELEFLDTLEYNGQTYMAFFPAVEEDADEEGEDYGLIILKVLEETARRSSPPWTPTRSSTRSMTTSWRNCSRTRGTRRNKISSALPF